MSSPSRDDRRQHDRTYLPVIARVFAQGEASGAACLVRDISLGGALLESAPDLRADEACRIEFLMAERQIGAVAARVLRIGEEDNGSKWLAVVFDELMTLTAQLPESSLGGFQFTLMPEAVLIVDSHEDSLVTLVRYLEGRPVAPLLAATAYQARRWLKSEGHRVTLVLVGAELTRDSPSELLEWIGQSMPGLHRVVLHGGLSVAKLDELLHRSKTEPAPAIPWVVW